MTTTVPTIIIAVLVLAVGLFVLRAVPGVRAYARFKGKRLITCPETNRAAAVDVAAGEAAIGTFLNEPTLRLVECSRWPERQDCGQACLKQVEIDPQNCLVWSIVAKWYEGKNCVFCQKAIGPIHHLDHAPALLAPDFRTASGRTCAPRSFPKSSRRINRSAGIATSPNPFGGCIRSWSRIARSNRNA